MSCSGILSNRAIFNFGPSLHVLVTMLYMNVVFKVIIWNNPPLYPPTTKMFLLTRTLANALPHSLPFHCSHLLFPLFNIWFSSCHPKAMIASVGDSESNPECVFTSPLSLSSCLIFESIATLFLSSLAGNEYRLYVSDGKLNTTHKYKKEKNNRICRNSSS